MKFNSVIIGSDAYPKLTGQTPTQSSSTTTNNGLHIETGSGYIRVGPQNTSYCHIVTDRGQFYFNKKMIVDSGIVSSYDEDLVLRRTDNSSHQITVSSSQVTSTLGITAPDATLGNTSTGVGALRLYDTGNNSLLFYGTGTNAFQMDMQGTSSIGTLTMSDFDIHMSTGNFTRGQHHTGHLEGSYNNVGANGSKSNPIYTIGSSYNPNETSLSNMYGIGYARSDASYLSSFPTLNNNWGLYVAADGDARIWMDAQEGQVMTTGGYRVGTTEIIDSSRNITGNELRLENGWKITAEGSGYAKVSSWVRMEGTGIYTTSNTHVDLDDSSSSWSVRGTSNQDLIRVSTADSNQIRFYANAIHQGGIRRSSHQVGHLEGGHNNIGSTATKTSPIYTIGSSYNPNESDLSNMYGIGYTHSDASFITTGGASGWGMYVAADGDARVFLSGSYGHVVSTGEHFAGEGSAGTPGYTFNNDQNTGMYRYAADQIGFATAGTHRMSIDSTGLRLSTGAYLAPSSTESTKIKSAAGSCFLQIRNSSDVLHGGVYGSGNDIGFLDKDSQWAIRHTGDSRTYFYINNSERVHIDNDGLDIVQGSLMMSGEKVIREKTYSGTGNIGTSGAWYTLCYITEQSVPVYINLKYSAHSTQTFVVTTGYHGSNVASIQMLSGTWTQNGAYPGASAVRILKDSSNNYRFQLQLTYSSGPTAFTLYARVWGGTPEADVVSLQSSLTVDTTTGSTISSLNTSFTGSGSSMAHRGADGTSSLPSYTFHNDSNTGMYRAGTDQVTFSAGGSQHLNVTNGSVDVGTTAGNTRLVIYKADNNVSDHLMFYLGSTRVGEIGCEDTSWLRINQETNKNIYTPRMFRADGGLQTKNGSAGSPGLTFYTDTNTGIFNNGADNIGFSTAGTNRVNLSNTKLALLAGLELDLETSSGNVRGQFLASESTPHLRIATSNGESIGFFDGGTSGVENIRIEGSGHLNLYTGDLKINDTTVISTSRALQNITSLDMTASTTADVDLNRSGWITFYGNSARHHAIGSRNNLGNADDDIRINSYGAVWINLDSNGNDSNSNHSSFFIGKHGQATNTISNLFKVDGETADVTTSGNVTAYGSPSDIRLKENIELIPNAVEKVQKLDGITFTYKKDGKRSTGLIAQQLQEVLPEVVYEAEDVQTEEKHLAVRYGNVVGLLVEAIKEQQTQLTAQQEQINQLTTLVNKLMEK